MINIKHTFTSHLSKEILGGALGMIVAIMAYSLSSQEVTKGLLVDSNPTIAVGSAEVRVNDKNVNPEVLKRLAARADRISKQVQDSSQAVTAEGISSSVSSETIVPTATDHSDRAAWIAMREKQRSLSSAHDLALRKAAEEQAGTSSVAMTEQETSSIPSYAQPSPDDGTQIPSDTHLPDSGPLLNVTLLLALGLAGVLHRKSLIAALSGAN
ncbi:hypothetical protein EXS65_02720 [Candidatus Peribacteria bacterium]|nr:hypothetical protein [Candidatus Peribacteria bacterium]